MDTRTLSDIVVAHRRAMMLYRKEHPPLGRNAIELLLYASTKPGITINEAATKLLYTNFAQAQSTVDQLVKRSLLFPVGDGVKGKPKRFWVTEAANSVLKNMLTDFTSAYRDLYSK